MRAASIALFIGMAFGTLTDGHGAPPAPPLRLTIGAAHSTTIPWIQALQEHVVPEFTRRLDGHVGERPIEWIEAYGGSLYKWQDTLEAVEIGLADIGWVGTLWENSKLPLQNITYSLPFISDDLPTLLQVMNELHADVPAVSAAWEKYNQRYLGASGVDTYHLLTKFPIKSLDDLRGKKLLAPGTSAVWLQGTGAVAVDGALSSYYTQLKTGVADGTVTILTGAHPYRIYEVAPYITLVGIGAQFTGALSVNLDVWNALPVRAQQVLSDLGREYTTITSAEAMRRYAAALDAMATAGAIVSTLPAIEKQRWIDGLPPLAKQWVERNEAKGLPAREVLTILMARLRAAGAPPTKNWDRDIDQGIDHGIDE